MPVISGPPTPTVPAVALPGFSFSQAINSLRSFAGKVLRATIHCGVSASSDTGSKSFTTSYGGFAHKAPLRESFCAKYRLFVQAISAAGVLLRIVTRLARSGQSSQLPMSAFGGKADI